MTLNRKAAFVDLGSKTVEVKEIPQRLRELYLGGRGIDAHLLFNLSETNVDPIAPQSVFLVGAGLLAGTPAPTASAIHIRGVSPLTGAIGGGVLEGWFGPELRFAGFDHLVIRGKASNPVYLWVQDGELEIRDASTLWGTDCFEVQMLIRESMNDEDIQVIAIGAAGENLVQYATVSTGLGSRGGCTGMGAVMGSKNLKAVAVRGTLPIEVSDPEKSLRCLSDLMALARSHGQTEAKGWVASGDVSGDLGPQSEWSRLAGFLDGDERIRRLGLDPSKTAEMILWISELRDRGLLPREFRCGFSPDWNSADTVFQQVKEIAYREGLGAWLAEGRNGAVRRLGLDTDHDLGQDGVVSSPTGMKYFPPSFPRENDPAFPASQTVLKKIFDRKKITDDYEMRALAAVWFESLGALADALGLGESEIPFLSPYLSGCREYSSLLHAVTGLQYTPGELMRVGERICNLERLFNIGQNLTRRGDASPMHPSRESRFLSGEMAAKDSTGAGQKKSDLLIEVYYEARGWDEKGRPTSATLQRLDLEQEPRHLF